MLHIKKAHVAIAIFSLFFICSARAEERPQFDDKSVIAVMKGAGGISLYSYNDPFEGLGIASVENLDAEDTGGISLFSAGTSEQTLLLTLEEAGEENVLSVVDALNEMDEVEYAQPNYCYYLDATVNDYYYQRSYQYNLSKVGAEYVWDMDIDASGIVVAVLDSGMSMSHEDLAGNLWTNSGEIPDNGKDDDGNGYIDDVNGWDFGNSDKDPTDYESHGTHVAGIVSAVTNNKLGVASLARNAKIVPLKIFTDSGSSFSSSIYKALRYVKTMGFKVANCSWGGSNYDATVRRYIRQCSNTVFVVAAGNAEIGKAATNNDNTPVYPASYNLSNIIAVASTDRDDTLSSFSNYGRKSVDIAAPGAGIYSTVTGSYKYSSMSGTSMATPLVTSLAALVRAQRPDFSVTQTINAILNGADTVSALSGTVAGSRRMNAYKTLDAISPTPTPNIKPIQVPQAKAAKLIYTGDSDDADYEGMYLELVFEDGAEPDLEDMVAYAVYKNEGVVQKVQSINLREDFTADIRIPSGFEGCNITVYVWNKDMQPYCAALSPSEEQLSS